MYMNFHTCTIAATTITDLLCDVQQRPDTLPDLTSSQNTYPEVGLLTFLLAMAPSLSARTAACDERATDLSLPLVVDCVVFEVLLEADAPALTEADE